MAVPFLAPLIWLLPLIKILALGSIKFVGVGLGAAIAPVTTANFLVNMSSGTPFKYAKFRHKKGDLTDEQLAIIKEANQLISDSVNDKEQSMSRPEAREFLKEMLVGTIAGMKQSIVSLSSAVVRWSKHLVSKVFK